jgi:GTPase
MSELEQFKDIKILQEIRIGVGGNVDAGKSSFVGVITKQVLDNGRGYARSLIMRYKHEIESGRTSSIAQHYIQLPNKIIELVDLAGHEKYLKTTISGISGCMLDYIAIIINANTGIQQCTREHMNIVFTMKIPMFVVFTKIDICPKNIYTMNIENIKKFYKKKMNLDTKIINSIEDLHELLTNYKYGDHHNTVPVFPISNVNGLGIDILKEYIYSLIAYRNYESLYNKTVEFCISRNYSVSGIGLVVSGVMKSGAIKKGDILYLGPNSDGFIRDKNNIIISESTNLTQNQSSNYYKVIIKGIHDNFRNNIDILYAGQSGCFNIKSVSNKQILKRNCIKKGMRILSDINSVRQFKAKIKILHNPSTITIRYQPILHCAGVSQTVQIIQMDKEYLRSHDEAFVIFKFMYKPEFIQKDDIFVFREGITKGIGKVMEIF